jgi:hypothetical protein
MGGYRTCRDGEVSRQYLIECSERYLCSHTVNGYTGGDVSPNQLEPPEKGGNSDAWSDQASDAKHITSIANGVRRHTLVL